MYIQVNVSHAKLLESSYIGMAEYREKHANRCNHAHLTKFEMFPSVSLGICLTVYVCNFQSPKP